MKPAAALARAAHAAWRRKGLASALLLPLSWISAGIVARKRRRYRDNPQYATRSPHPVIVVGNLYVGGTGKTPVVLALIEALRARGWHPGVVSRGYGGRARGEPLVGQGRLPAELYGDEPALIAEAGRVPVAVHPRRALALQALQAQHPEVDLIIADDGLQHLALARDVEIVVQDVRGLGNGRLLPAGPLREPAARLAEVDYIVTNLSAGEQEPAGPATPAHRVTMRLAPGRMRHLASGRELDWDAWLSEYRHARAGALAGIGQPQRYFDMLRAHGLKLAQTLALPDHAQYAQAPFGRFDTDLVLLTAKDAVKCHAWADERVWVVEAVPRFAPAGWFDELHARLAALAPGKAAAQLS
ncbi:tetraacyldisaccharide 4'-kinase [Candidimonas humi]|uniref:Tetraacyldisaccharide 4'-kinase n=1 Tax=Candidimonas humi TaxID=683355 RepID=A0ABV8NUZ6_9BURK